VLPVRDDELDVGVGSLSGRTRAGRLGKVTRTRKRRPRTSGTLVGMTGVRSQPLICLSNSNSPSECLDCERTCPRARTSNPSGENIYDSHSPHL